MMTTNRESRRRLSRVGARVFSPTASTVASTGGAYSYRSDSMGSARATRLAGTSWQPASASLPFRARSRAAPCRHTGARTSWRALARQHLESVALRKSTRGRWDKVEDRREVVWRCTTSITSTLAPAPGEPGTTTRPHLAHGPLEIAEDPNARDRDRVAAIGSCLTADGNRPRLRVYGAGYPLEIGPTSHARFKGSRTSFKRGEKRSRSPRWPMPPRPSRRRG